MHVHTADSVWAFELGQRAGEIAGRLGVEKLRFAPGTASGGRRDRLSRTPLEPTAEDDAQAQELAAAIGDENLRESVQKAVRLGLARERRDHPI